MAWRAEAARRRDDGPAPLRLRGRRAAGKAIIRAAAASRGCAAAPGCAGRPATGHCRADGATAIAGTDIGAAGSHHRTARNTSSTGSAISACRSLARQRRADASEAGADALCRSPGSLDAAGAPARRNRLRAARRPLVGESGSNGAVGNGAGGASAKSSARSCAPEGHSRAGGHRTPIGLRRGDRAADVHSTRHAAPDPGRAPAGETQSA